jgi:hypothetical protein
MSKSRRSNKEANIRALMIPHKEKAKKHAEREIAKLKCHSAKIKAFLLERELHLGISSYDKVEVKTKRQSSCDVQS